MLLFHSPAFAQLQFNYPARLGQVSTGWQHRSWTLERGSQKTEISETIFPLAATSEISDNFTLVFFTAHAGAVLNSDQQLQGLADGKIKAFYQIIPHQLLLNLGISLPYGKNQLTTSEFQVADFLFEQILGFGVNRFGEGLDWDLGVSAAFPVARSMNLGIGLGYLAKGEFEYLTGTTQTYQPGNEYLGTIGLDFRQDSLFARGDLLAKFYSRDLVAGADFIQQGSQIEVTAQGKYTTFPWCFSLLSRWLLKNENDFFQSSELIPVEGVNFIKNSVFGYFDIAYRFRRPVAIFGEVTLSRFGESDLQIGDATLFSGGGGLEYKFGEKMLANFHFNYLFGTAAAGDLTLHGWDSRCAIQFRF